MERVHIKTPKDIISLISIWANERQENFLAITLNSHHDVINVHHISKGTVDKAIVHPRECFYHAIIDNASSILFAHNHPSGHIDPSPEDDKVCERLVLASEILCIPIMDFVIIAEGGLIFSYRAYEKLPQPDSQGGIEMLMKILTAELL